MRAAVRVIDGRRLELMPAGRPRRGAYRLDWRSVSTIDGHMREGSIGFGVGTRALGAASELKQSPLDGGRPARIVVRWLFYAALFAFAGGLLAGSVIAPRARLGAWLALDTPRGLLR
jgi:hypothetical protein